MDFSLTSVNVLVLMAYAIPGYIFVKVKALSLDSIGALVKILLFVCQPFLTIYSFNKADFTPALFKEMIMFFLVAFILQVVMLGITYLIYRNKYKQDAAYRVCTIATALGNIGYIGVPLIEALLPNQPNAVVFAAMFIVSMDLVGWTIASTIITGNMKYVSFKRIALNPLTFALMVALPLFLTGTKIPAVFDNSVTILGKMTTPLSMIILGMRLASTKFKTLFTDHKVYFVAGLKLIVFPLVAFLAVYFLPLDAYAKNTLLILSCTPTASFVLNLSELHNTGQKTAANIVLTSNIFSMITIPVIMLFFSAS